MNPRVRGAHDTAAAWVAGGLDQVDLEQLLSPLAVGPVTLPNRVVMSAMGTRMGREGGEVSSDQVAYYERRAKGGVGAVVVEGSSVHPEGTTYDRKPRLYDDRFVGGLTRLANAIREAGAVAGIQLMHAGRHAAEGTRSGPPAGAGSSLSRVTGVRSRPLDTRGIDDVIDSFGAAAQRAVAAGFELLEIHAAHGYLLHDFLSPLQNDRDDEWGLLDRTRLLREVVARVTDAVGARAAVAVRLSSFEPGEAGIGPGQAVEGALAAEKAGADAVFVSAGNNESLEWVVPPVFMPPGLSLETARLIRASVSMPTGVVGRISTPEIAAEAVSSGAADLVLLGRALLADPDFVRKLHDGGRPSNPIRPCIACNECLAQHLRDEPILCTVNPVAGRESLEHLASARTVRPRRVLVIGGGPAGMLFSAIVARRGHSVTLAERASRLGGKVWLAAAAPYKETEMFALLESLRAELELADVKVRLGVTDVQGLIDDAAPEVVVASTGAWPRGDPLLGTPLVSQAEDYLAAPDAATWQSARRVAIIGAGDTACDAAARLASAGVSVWMLARGNRMARGIEPVSGRELRRYLTRLGVTVEFDCSRIRVEDGAVLYDRAGSDAQLGVDLVLVARGVDSSADDVTASLRIDDGVDVVRIGDARDPGNFLTALRSAWDAAVAL